MAEKEPFDEVEQWEKEVIIIEPGSSVREKIPPHDYEACGQCTFVANGDSIVVTKEQQEQAQRPGENLSVSERTLKLCERYIVELGLFTLPDWPGHSMWYVFQCPDCDALVRDYTHGHRLYIKCCMCEFHWNLQGKRFFQQAGLPELPTWLQQFKELWKLRKRFHTLRSG